MRIPPGVRPPIRVGASYAAGPILGLLEVGLGLARALARCGDHCLPLR